MTCGDGMAEGLGRVLAVRTKQEAADVTVAIPQPEKEFDPTISDIWRAEDLGVVESENVPRETKDAEAPVETTPTDFATLAPALEELQSTDRQIAQAIKPWKETVHAKNDELRGTRKERDHAQSANIVLAGRVKELEAQLASAANGRNPMKWSTFVIALFAVAIGLLYSINSRTNERVDVLMDYYLAHEYGPEAMQGKTCLEVTPEVANIGINQFIPIVRQMPYTDAAALERLFNGEDRWVVAKLWGEGANAVVRLDNWEDDGPFGIFGKTWTGKTHRERSVLIHPHPTSLGVYNRMMESSYNRLTALDFRDRRNYDVASEGALRVADYVAIDAPITHEELVRLGDMSLMWDYGNGVLCLVDQFGTGERFIRLADDDYRNLQLGTYYSSSYASKLRYESSSWWYTMERSIAKKEEQTTAKVGE